MHDLCTIAAERAQRGCGADWEITRFTGHWAGIPGDRAVFLKRAQYNHDALVRTLYRITRALQTHVNDAAKAAGIEPERLCPCMSEEISEARKILERLGKLKPGAPFSDTAYIPNQRRIITMPTNKENFQNVLAEQYRELFRTHPDYQHMWITPEVLAEKMTHGLATGEANKEGEGIKRTCKALGIKQTYKEIRAYLNA